MLNKLFICLALLVVFLGSAAAEQVQNISAVQARELLEQDQQPFLLDVRTPQEYFEVRMAAANLIPIDQIRNRRAEIPAQKPILVYCAVGSRSSQVANYLAREGYGPVYNLYGGIWAWQLRNFPVEKGAP